jgi:hypothetical protein
LLVANANRGPVLLGPDTMATVCLSLDRFRDLGLQSVKFAVHYPLLRPDFPRAPEYLAFYRQVVQEARRRGLKVMPHVTVLFADTPFSPFHDLYDGLDMERFKREYRDQVQLIVRELQPEYLALLTEPDTHARLTGLRELNEPETFAEVIRRALDGLDRGQTRIGAGSGSWSPPEFVEALAERTDVDFICMHIYPVSKPLIDNVRRAAHVARAHGKALVVDEAWLYKTLKPGGGGSVAAAAEVFRLDAYSFWEPLDVKFASLVLRLAAEERIEMVSFFWSSQLFCYTAFDPDLDRLPYQAFRQQTTRRVYRSMLEGGTSGFGEWLRREVAARPSGTRTKEAPPPTP